MDLADWTPHTVTLSSLSSPTADTEDWTWVIDTGSGGGSGPTLPVGGYQGWWDASAITGLADGAAVSSWADSSGSGLTLLQATGANQPTYYSTTAGKLVNGHPAVWFNGGQNLLAALPSDRAEPYTVMCVARNTDTASFNDRIVWSSDGNPSQVYLMESTGGSGAWFVQAGNTLTSTSIPAATLHFTAAGITTGSGYLTQDATTDTHTFTAVSLSGYFVLGGLHNPAANPWEGPICEAAVYPFLLGTSDVATLRSYCQAKWGTP